MSEKELLGLPWHVVREGQFAWPVVLHFQTIRNSRNENIARFTGPLAELTAQTIVAAVNNEATEDATVARSGFWVTRAFLRNKYFPYVAECKTAGTEPLGVEDYYNETLRGKGYKEGA